MYQLDSYHTIVYIVLACLHVTLVQLCRSLYAVSLQLVKDFGPKRSVYLFFQLHFNTKLKTHNQYTGPSSSKLLCTKNSSCEKSESWKKNLLIPMRGSAADKPHHGNDVQYVSKAMSGSADSLSNLLAVWTVFSACPLLWDNFLSHS